MAMSGLGPRGGFEDERLTTAAMAIDRSGQGARIALTGDLRIGGVGAVLDPFAAVAGPGPVVVDASGLEGFDTAGAWAIASLRRRLQGEGVDVRVEGLSPARAALLDDRREGPARGRGARAAGRPASSAGSPRSARASSRGGWRPSRS